MGIEFNEDWKKAKFIKRENRFVATIEVDGKKVPAHVPSSGRMEELLFPGQRVIVAFKDEPHRKTKYELALVSYGEGLVSINSQLPNKLLETTLCNRELKEFEDYTDIKREYTYQGSRFDFKLEAENEVCLVEVKSVTLVEDKIAKFPDAPTKRGRRHLQELIKAKQEGYRTVVIFLIQRSDAEIFRPNDRIDLQFGDYLRQAAKAGVEILAYNCDINLQGIKIKEKVKVDLSK